MIHTGDHVYKRGTNPYRKGNIGIVEGIASWEDIGEMFRTQKMAVFTVKFWDRTEELPATALRKAPYTMKAKE